MNRGLDGFPRSEPVTGVNRAGQGRLTLVTADPVPAADQTAQTTIYYTPYVGELVPIYTTLWRMKVFSELSLALDSDSGHTGYHQSGKNFDLFVVRDAAGKLSLGTGPAWTSDTARGTGAGTTELQRVNGLRTNKNSMALRLGSAAASVVNVAAGQGTYAGTMRASANGQTEDSLAKRFLWNTESRVPRPMKVLESTDSWTYSTTTWRQKNNSTANQLALVRGLNEDNVFATANIFMSSSTATYRIGGVSIGLDSTTVFDTNCLPVRIQGNSSFALAGTSTYFGLPGLGYHFLASLEHGGGTDTQTHYGDNGADGFIQSGIQGEVTA